MWFYFLMHLLGVLKLFYWFNRHKKIVLTYHNVIPDLLFDNSIHLGVSHRASVFEHHMMLIKKITNDIVITFDDGYKNQYKIAASILEKYDLKGIFFVTARLILTGSTLTIDKITQWISYVPSGSYTIFGTTLLIMENNRDSVVEILYQQLLSDYPLWEKIEDELNNLYLFDDLVINSELKKLRFSPITQDELSRLIGNGHAVAAHGWDHKPLSTLPINMQHHDFTLCKQYAEKYCNSNCYSYPFGTKIEVSPDTMHLCEQHGFSKGYMNTEWVSDVDEKSACYQLPRLNLPNSSNQYLIHAKLSGFEFFIKKLWLWRVS